ncbi:MAG: hypothetical protein WD800_07570 [Dehalococcoidia bacterium]
MTDGTGKSHTSTRRADTGSADAEASQGVATEAPSCVHYWLLSEPVAGAISGRCQRCGQDRVFSAHPEGTDRFDDYRELTQASAYYSPARETKASAS